MDIVFEEFFEESQIELDLEDDLTEWDSIIDFSDDSIDDISLEL